MKKTIIFLSILFAFSSISFRSIAGPIITFKLEFGKPSCDCCGFGFCRFEIGFDFNKEKIPLAGDGSAFGTITLQNGKALFTFYKKSMSPETIKKYFSNGYFIVDEKILLPEEITKLLKISKYEVPIGRYKITDLTDTFTVKI